MSTQEETKQKEIKERMCRVHQPALCKCCDNLMVILESEKSLIAERVRMETLREVLKELEPVDPKFKLSYELIEDKIRCLLSPITTKEESKC